ncbi:unnamed protein product [Peniophora sp. CBMAI 1063]|nr:unnamed protein product [Peniophora sp. CBMAI 1063]
MTAIVVKLLAWIKAWAITHTSDEVSKVRYDSVERSRGWLRFDFSARRVRLNVAVVRHRLMSPDHVLSYCPNV